MISNYSVFHRNHSTIDHDGSGDVLVSVNGRSVKTVRDVLDAIGLEAGHTLELQVSDNHITV